jgi:aminopeptidase N
MLRGAIGTETFWTGIRDYYRRYRNQNASTDDFRQVMEQAAGVPLQWFFDQWLTRAGMPALRGSWRYDAGSKQVQIEITQAGEPYRLPMEIALVGPAGQSRIERIELTKVSGQFTFAADVEPASVVLDPNTWVLMEAPAFIKRVP